MNQKHSFMECVYRSNEHWMLTFLFSGDEFSAKFLIENRADVNSVTDRVKETPLHLAASFNPDVTDVKVMEGMSNVACTLLKTSAGANSQDSEGK